MSINKKLLKVKSNLESVKKKSNNPFFKSRYADLNAHLDLVEPLLEAEGLILLQPCCLIEGRNVVKTMIVDAESEESVESMMFLVGDTDMQKLGSAVTYARRYTLGALLAIQAEDDDANQAVSKPQPKGGSRNSDF